MSWKCQLCEYDENNGTLCEMCDTPRPNQQTPSQSTSTISTDAEQMKQAPHNNTNQTLSKSKPYNQIDDKQQQQSMWHYQMLQQQPHYASSSQNNMISSTINDTNSSKEGWSCTACTFYNDVGTIQCKMCTLYNPNIMNNTLSNEENKIQSNISTPQFKSSWKCKQCSKTNEQNSFFCDACGYRQGFISNEPETADAANNNNTKGLQPDGENCSSCGVKHIAEDKFKWSLCKHVYGKQCAESVAISHLFYNAIPKCTKCNELLLMEEAKQILQSSELSIYSNILQMQQNNIMNNNKNNDDQTSLLPNKQTEDELKSFLNGNQLSMDLYQILMNEDIGYKQLPLLTLNDIDSLFEGHHIKLRTKINFKNAVQSLKQNNEQKQQSFTSNRETNIEPKDEKKEEALYIDRRQTYMFENPDHKMKIVIIGDSTVGKTSLMCRYVKNVFDEYVISSIGVDSMINKEKLSDDSIMELEIWDTAGQERFQAVCKNYYRRADAIIVCFDVTNELSFDNCQNWRDQIENCAKDNVIVLLVGCKGDMLRKNDKDKIETYDEGHVLSDTDEHKTARNEAEQKALKIIKSPEWKQFGTIYCECSAKKGSNVRNVFITAAELVLQQRIEMNEIIYDKKKGQTPGYQGGNNPSSKERMSELHLEQRLAENDDNRPNNKRKCC